MGLVCRFCTFSGFGGGMSYGLGLWFGRLEMGHGESLEIMSGKRRERPYYQGSGISIFY